VAKRQMIDWSFFSMARYLLTAGPQAMVRPPLTDSVCPVM
jgi:hypothetical protein